MTSEVTCLVEAEEETEALVFELLVALRFVLLLVSIVGILHWERLWKEATPTNGLVWEKAEGLREREGVWTEAIRDFRDVCVEIWFGERREISDD